MAVRGLTRVPPLQYSQELSEFTGERVIPGQVDIDLWNEHVSRYAFASAFAAGKRVLDLGCGTGYGSAEMGKTAASVMGVDVSSEAVEYARAHYGSSTVFFETGSCTDLPWQAELFDCIVAFEVIEHLNDWRGLLSEAKRLLGPGGTFLVSTPNQRYYAEQREQAGPNPYHVHEFEYAEFRDALAECFPSVTILLQNRTEALAFDGGETAGEARLHLNQTVALPADSHFFLAVCGTGAVNPQPFVYVPSSANLLREREQHIARLASEVSLKTDWLADITRQRDTLQQEHSQVIAHIEERNRWAQGLELDLGQAQKRIVELQDSLAAEQATGGEVASAYESKIGELERDLHEKTDWALETERRLTADVQSKCNELADAVRLLDNAETKLEERTRWAMSLDERLRTVEAQLAMMQASRWVRLGRTVGLGPKLR